MLGVNEFQGIDLPDLSESALARHTPKTDVAAVLAAAAATASFEGGESINKKKKQAADELQKQFEEEMAAAENSTTPLVVGITFSGHAMVTHNGKLKLKFHPPVQLAPLERKKMRSQKKLVPLIEPDICNFVQIDFLPRALLRIKNDKLDLSLNDVQQQLAMEMAVDAAVASASIINTTTAEMNVGERSGDYYHQNNNNNNDNDDNIQSVAQSPSSPSIMYTSRHSNNNSGSYHTHQLFIYFM